MREPQLEPLLIIISRNASEEPHFDGDSWNSPYSPLVQIIGWLLAGLLALETIVGNALVLVAYWINSSISKQISNRFILSLAISDLIIGFEGIPLFTVYVINGDRWPLGAIACQTWLFLDYTLCLVSILTVLLITVDRYMSVCHTASYLRWQNPLRIQVMVLGSWIAPAVMFGLMIYGWGLISGNADEGHTNGECYAPFLSNPYVNMTLYLIYYWTTLVAMLILYNGIHRAAKKLEIKGRAKENRQIALLLTQRLGTQVGVGLMLKAQKNAAENEVTGGTPAAVRRNGTLEVKDSGYNTNTLSTNLSELNERRRWSSCYAIEAKQRIANGSIKPLFFERGPSPLPPSMRLRAEPPSKVQEEEIEEAESFAKKEQQQVELTCQKPKTFRAQQDTCSLSLNSQAFEEASLASVLRFISNNGRDGGPFGENAEDRLSASDNTSLVILRNSIKLKQKRPHSSSLKLPKASPELGASNSPKQQSKSFREPRRRHSSRRHKKGSPRGTGSNERLPHQMDSIVESAEAENPHQQPPQVVKRFLDGVGRRLGSDGRPKITRSRTLCVAREVRRRKSSARSFLADIHYTVTRTRNQTNWLDRLFCWLFGIHDTPQTNAENTDEINSKKANQALRSIGCSSDSGSDSDSDSEGTTEAAIAAVEEVKKKKGKATRVSVEQEPKIGEEGGGGGEVPKLRVSTTTSQQHRQSTDSVLSSGASTAFHRHQQQRRSRVGSGVGAVLTAGADVATAMKQTGNHFVQSLLSGPINVFTRRRKRTKAERRAHKAFRTITFIVGLFAILWSPYFLMATIYGFCKGECISPFIYNLSYYLCYLNSAGNPFMYSLANSQFRSTFIQILKGNFKKT